MSNQAQAVQCTESLPDTKTSYRQIYKSSIARDELKSGDYTVAKKAVLEVTEMTPREAEDFYRPAVTLLSKIYKEFLEHG